MRQRDCLRTGVSSESTTIISANSGSLISRTRSSKAFPPISRNRLSRPMRRLFPPAMTMPDVPYTLKQDESDDIAQFRCIKQRGGGTPPHPLFLSPSLQKTLERLALPLIRPTG